MLPVPRWMLRPPGTAVLVTVTTMIAMASFPAASRPGPGVLQTPARAIFVAEPKQLVKRPLARKTTSQATGARTKGPTRDVAPTIRSAGPRPAINQQSSTLFNNGAVAIRPAPGVSDTPGRPPKDRPGSTRPGSTTPGTTTPPVVDLPPKTRPGSRPPRPDGTPEQTPDRPVVPPVVVIPLPPPRLPPAIAIPARPSVPPMAVLPLPLSPPSGLPPSLPPATPPAAGAPPASLLALAQFAPDEVLITLPTSTPETLEAAVAQSFNLTILERAPLGLIDARLVRLRIPDQRAVPAVVAALQGDLRVPTAQPNFYYRRQQTPTLQPAAATNGGLQYALAKLSIADAQLMARGRRTPDRGTRVAVIDSGIERRHPDFVGVVLDEFDALDAGSTSESLNSHGTGVAGIIAARGLVQGVAPDVQLLSARAFGGGGAPATTSALLKSLTWAVFKGARVINMSFAGPRDSLMERNIATLPERRVLAIAAAGNGGSKAAPTFPAAYPQVLAVTATDAQDRLYDKANQGNYIAIAAPGVDVLVPAGQAAHELQSGTSFATPHVVGIVALMLDVNPDLSPEHIRQLLLATADDLGEPGRDDQFGAGRVNAARAVAAASTFKSVLAIRP